MFLKLEWVCFGRRGCVSEIGGGPFWSDRVCLVIGGGPFRSEGMCLNMRGSVSVRGGSF